MIRMLQPVPAPLPGAASSWHAAALRRRRLVAALGASYDRDACADTAGPLQRTPLTFAHVHAAVPAPVHEHAPALERVHAPVPARGACMTGLEETFALHTCRCSEASGEQGSAACHRTCRHVDTADEESELRQTSQLSPGRRVENQHNYHVHNGGRQVCAALPYFSQAALESREALGGALQQGQKLAPGLAQHQALTRGRASLEKHAKCFDLHLALLMPLELAALRALEQPGEERASLLLGSGVSRCRLAPLETHLAASKMNKHSSMDQLREIVTQARRPNRHKRGKRSGRKRRMRSHSANVHGELT